MMKEDMELVELRQRRIRELMGADPGPGAAGPIRIDDDAFEVELRKPGVLFVDLWAAWCGPCIQMGPVIDALARDYRGRVRVAKLNVDESPYTPARYGVTSIPTFLIFRDGKLVDELVGSMPRQMLESRLRQWIQAAA